MKLWSLDSSSSGTAPVVNKIEWKWNRNSAADTSTRSHRCQTAVTLGGNEHVIKGGNGYVFQRRRGSALFCTVFEAIRWWPLIPPARWIFIYSWSGGLSGTVMLQTTQTALKAGFLKSANKRTFSHHFRRWWQQMKLSGNEWKKTFST